MSPCNYPGREQHPLTKRYWQTDEYGDICEACHPEYLAERGVDAWGRPVPLPSVCECWTCEHADAKYDLRMVEMAMESRARCHS